MDAEHTTVDSRAETFGDDASSKRGARRFPWRLLALGIFLALLATGAWLLLRPPHSPNSTASHGAGTRPIPVATAVATIVDAPVTLDALGTVTPLATVTVRPRIAGHLMQVAFTEGQHVRKGDLLALVDPRPYQAALAEAEGQLARDKALLRNAEVDLQRYRQLVAEDSIARQQLDTQAALVEQYRGTVQMDQALVETARLNLAYCRIESPIDGRVGLRQVDIGNYVQSGDSTGIVVITQMQPISVIFTLPQDDLPAVLARLHAGASLPVTAYDRSGIEKLATGVLSTVDNQIDSATGTIRLRAQFDNADEDLFPNQFVNVRLLLNTRHNATMVPSAAVQRGSKGNYVYVVGKGDIVSVQPVTVGLSTGDKTQVTTGISAGDRVVIDGLDRLRDGLTVEIIDAPDAPAAPPIPSTTPKSGRAPAAAGGMSQSR